MFYTYVLECISTKSKRKILYIGVTDNLVERIKDHKSKSTNTTKQFDIIKLIYYEACLNKKDAYVRENQLKTGFGRGYLKRRNKSYFTKRV